MKVLKPVGFKLLPHGQLKGCIALQKGKPLSAEQAQGKTPMNSENIWWLLQLTSRQIIAAYEVNTSETFLIIILLLHLIFLLVGSFEVASS